MHSGLSKLVANAVNEIRLAPTEDMARHEVLLVAKAQNRGWGRVLTPSNFGSNA